MTLYHSSTKGPVEIEAMNYSHLVNAHAKLSRTAPHRVAEIDAMTRRIAVLDAEYQAESNTRPGDA